jgi:hypothetical protein
MSFKGAVENPAGDWRAGVPVPFSPVVRLFLLPLRLIVHQMRDKSAAKVIHPKRGRRAAFGQEALKPTSLFVRQPLA